MTILLGLLAAMAFSLGIALQQRGTMATSAGEGDWRFLAEVIRQPIWALGGLMSVVGWVLQTAALPPARSWSCRAGRVQPRLHRADRGLAQPRPRRSSRGRCLDSDRGWIGPVPRRSAERRHRRADRSSLVVCGHGCAGGGRLPRPDRNATPGLARRRGAGLRRGTRVRVPGRGVEDVRERARRRCRRAAHVVVDLGADPVRRDRVRGAAGGAQDRFARHGGRDHQHHDVAHQCGAGCVPLRRALRPRRWPPRRRAVGPGADDQRHRESRRVRRGYEGHGRRSARRRNAS
jgi:hypothetical protein